MQNTWALVGDSTVPIRVRRERLARLRREGILGSPIYRACRSALDTEEMQGAIRVPGNHAARERNSRADGMIGTKFFKAYANENGQAAAPQGKTSYSNLFAQVVILNPFERATQPVEHGVYICSNP
jgi:hypothetical protein